MMNESGKTWNYELYDGDGIKLDMLAHTDSSEHPAAASTATSMSLPAGDYYMKVSGSTSAVNIRYSFIIRFYPSAEFETERNDTLPTADLIEVNKNYFGELHHAKDMDSL